MALQADLAIAAIGVVVVFFGSALTAGGLADTNGSVAPHALLGTIMFFAGIVLILLGIGLAVANLVLYLTARRRGGESGRFK